MQLQALLKDFVELKQDCTITGLASDTRKLSPGQVFVALKGPHGHSLNYAAQAIAQGATAILYDPQTVSASTVVANEKYPLIAIDNLNEHLGTISARFYDEPTGKMAIIGITGTNGKTSCSQFLGQLLEQCGIIGTLGWGNWGQLIFTGYTTPDALMTQEILAEGVKQHWQALAIEVSSHGIAEHRIGGIRFKGVVLTNISRDHLDFHGSMAAYIDTKKALFALPDNEFAVINLDDTYSDEFIAVIPDNTVIWGFSIGSKTIAHPKIHQVYADNINPLTEGLRFDVCLKDQRQVIQVPLYGEFNVENILAVITVMLALGHSLSEIAEKVRGLAPVTGRMQRFGDHTSALIFVDYAHTPDALHKALISARQHCKNKLWVVFGCGGDRDTGKRPEMGSIAEQYADHVIITDDNPRSESPSQIVQDILSGCQSDTIRVIHNRAEAIRQAILSASTEDCIVIAGKGHELYQEYKSQKLPFSDAEVVIQVLASRATQ